MADKIILLDTDFAFELLHKNVNAETFIEANHYSVIAISSITFFERVKSCMNKMQLNNLQKQLPKFFYLIPVEAEISDMAGQSLKLISLESRFKNK